MNFIEFLKKGQKEDLQSIIEQQQNDLIKEGRESEINLGFSIPNYDMLMEILKCDDCGTPIIDESFGDEVYFKLLKIFNTGLKGTYFYRLEEYGPGDVDAMKCSIIMTEEIEKKAQNIIKEYTRKSVIQEKNKMDLDNSLER